MVDILLIQPPIRDFYLTVKRTIPYGLTCIAAALRRDGFSVEIFDGLATAKAKNIDLPSEMSYLREYYGKPDLSPFSLFHNFKHYGYSFEYIAGIARKSGAFLVGISSLFTPYSNEAVKTAEIVKESHPECRIVLGGHHPTAMPKRAIESSAVDFVLRGEGEVSMPMLAKALRAGKPDTGLNSIPGIVFRREDGTVVCNEPVAMEGLDIYPRPAMGLIKHKFYKRGRKGSAMIVASRGCPMKCSYCSIGSPEYLTYRRRSVEFVVGEIDEVVHRHNVGFIDFEDENLSLDREWFLKLLREIRVRYDGMELEFRAMNGLFPPSLDEGVIREMKMAGFKTLNLSLGSTSSEQLKRFRRPDVRSALENNLDCADKYGLEAVVYVIASAPGQPAEDSVRDLLFLANKKALVGVSIFYPAPDSADFRLCEQLGILPGKLSLMRSSVLPLSHTTSRLEAVTLLRLGRILNFMKALGHPGAIMHDSLPFTSTDLPDLSNRRDIGIQLLRRFFHDGKIRGVTPDGEIYEHRVSKKLTSMFIEGLIG